MQLLRLLSGMLKLDVGNPMPNEKKFTMIDLNAYPHGY